jgi:hypothetical protein
MWTVLLVLFVVLAGIHVILFFQPDIQAPRYQHVPVHTVGTIAALDEHGNFVRDPSDTNKNLMVNDMEQLNTFATGFEHFVNADFSGVVKDINSGKRKSNGIAVFGYLFAAITCWLSRRATSNTKDGQPTSGGDVASRAAPGK